MSVRQSTIKTAGYMCFDNLLFPVREPIYFTDRRSKYYGPYNNIEVMQQYNKHGKIAS